MKEPLPLTDHLPKALVGVNGTPILENALSHLSAVGVRDTLVVTGAHAGVVVDELRDR